MALIIEQPQEASATINVQLKEKWSELLDVAECEVTAGSDFFSLGGNSMLLLSLHVFVLQEFNTGVTLAELFDNAKFCEMALLIGNRVTRT